MGSSSDKGKNESDDIMAANNPSLFNPLPFQIKADMAVAPLCRREKLSDLERGQLDFLVQYNVDCGNEFDFGDHSISNDGYLTSLKGGKGRCFEKTDIRCMKDSPEIQILDDDDENTKTPQVISGCQKWRMKLIQFHENRRPAYWGTWKRKAKRVTARKPTFKEEEVDYDFDSDDEWEDEPEDAEEIGDSDREETEEQNGGEPEDDEEGWMVPHGYLSGTERDGTGGDLESFKCKEKEFYKSLKEKTLIGLPFIETENLSCFVMRLCPVFKSAITIKPVRRRPKKAPQPKQEESETVEVKPTRKSVRIPKIPAESSNPYEKAPSGILALKFSNDDEDMDWDTNELNTSSSSSDSDSGEQSDDLNDEMEAEPNVESKENGSSSSSGDEDLFTPIVRPKV